MSKVNKKVLDAELSDEEEVAPKKVKASENKKAKQAKVESDESSDEEICVMKTKTQRKGSDKAKAPIKKQKLSEDNNEGKATKKTVKAPVKKEESSDEEDSSDEDVKVKKPQPKVIPAAKLVPAKKIAVKKEESSDEDSDDDDEDVKPKKVPVKKAPAKKQESDEDSDDEDVKPVKKAPVKKAPIKKEESSDDSDDDEDVKPKKAPVKKAPVKKEESSDEDSDDEDVKPVKKVPAKKEDDDSIEEEEIKPKKALQKGKKQEKEEEESDEIEKPKQIVSTELPANAYEELFVRNLSFNTSEESLAEYFGKYGDIEVVKIITDKFTQKSKGFGFVKFYDKASAVAAMNDAANIVVDSRNLQIRYSNDDSQRQNRDNKSQGRDYQKSNYSGEKHAIFVGNLSWKTNENSIKKYFSDCGNVVDIRIAKQPDGKMKGFAHVDFDSAEAVENAIKKNGVEFEGRPLKVDKSTPRQGGGAPRGGRGGFNRGGFNGGDSLAKAKKSGAMIMPTESKAVDLEDDDE